MAVGQSSTDFVAIKGVRLSAVSSGIKAEGTDLVLIEFGENTQSAAVFTQSIFAAAPVVLGKEHLAAMAPRYFLINSGNANAAVGEQGILDASTSCESISALTNVSSQAVMPFSTGVIGERLPVDKISAALPELMSQLDEEGWLVAARGIMTTDTRPKIGSRQIDIEGNLVTITGIAKGSGMIQPNMATMLSFLATDAAIDANNLDGLLRGAVEHTFNRITVDSDTSTNDTCTLSATAEAGVAILPGSPAFEQFDQALKSLCLELAQGIVRDGEGATKFIAVQVEGGANEDECLQVAYAVANSPLMKTALFASDANWGRIVMAIGKSGVNVPASQMDVYLGSVQLMKGGEKHRNYTEARGAEVMAQDEIVIKISLNNGDVTETVWTSDLSHDYVTINAEYRT